MRSLRFILATALLGLTGAAIAVPQGASAGTSFDISGPAGSGSFGEHVLVLSNGNFVVADPTYSTQTAPNVGAVYLFNGATRALISTLTGSTPNDNVGAGGLEEVGSSNFVVSSLGWTNGANDSAGAVTWVSGTAGLNGVVGPQNSLVGGSTDDFVGDVVLLENGNYLVGSPSWSNVGANDAGAVTWGSGNAGVSGPISATNSLVGTQLDDRVGSRIATLTNGHYVVGSPDWNNGAFVDVGAATWGNGTTGSVGEVSAANSLRGTSATDHVGDVIEALHNGNYVVSSASWSNPMPVAADAGAVTWGDGAAGTTGTVTSGNSVVGSTADDRVGDVFALENGNYVIASPAWDAAGVEDVGAVRLGSGDGGTSGPMTPANSLVGTQEFDQVGVFGVRELDNGNFVVLSVFWDNGPVNAAGAVTWSSGVTGTVGAVNAGNSIVGGSDLDLVGSGGAIALVNGNYAVVSDTWDNGAATDAGAVRLGSGLGGTTGLIDVGNSIVGTATDDHVGGGSVWGLTDGSFVITSPDWDGPVANVGAATYGAANGSTVGPVSVTNSLHGTTLDDRVGEAAVVVLPNGAYVVSTDSWDNGPIADVGAITWSGPGGIVGPLTPANSLYGSTAGDRLGSATSFGLEHTGNYVVASPKWDNGPIVDAGAFTWGRGSTGVVGPVTAANSLVGSTAGDELGSHEAFELSNGTYVVWSNKWDNGGIVDAGAITFGGLHGVVGSVSPTNSVIGSGLNDISTFAFERFTTEGAAVVGRPASNKVTLFILDIRDYIPLAPARIADTRPGFTTVDGQFAGIGERLLGSTLELTVAGRGGVPLDAVAATLNVTVTEATAPGFATVFPCGSAQPTASNLNFTTGSTVPNAVIAKIGTDGKVCIFVSQAVQLVVDVNGAFPVETSYIASNPARVLDTRPGFTTIDGLQQATGVAAASSVTEVQIKGRAGVPSYAVAVVLNVTVTEPAADGYATVYPCGTQPPTASNLNYTPGLTTPNLVIAKLGTDGKVCIFTQSAAHLIADVNGYFPDDTSYEALNPARLLDTRAGFPTVDGLGAGAGQRPLGSVTVVRVLGRGGVPAAATTAVLNVTVTEATAPGYVTVYPCGIDPPLASNVNFVANQNIPNAVLTKIGTNGDVCIFTSQPTQLIADVAGYFP